MYEGADYNAYLYATSTSPFLIDGESNHIILAKIILKELFIKLHDSDIDGRLDLGGRKSRRRSKKSRKSRRR